VRGTGERDALIEREWEREMKDEILCDGTGTGVGMIILIQIEYLTYYKRTLSSLITYCRLFSLIC
jgi:hypothetical protein